MDSHSQMNNKLISKSIEKTQPSSLLNKPQKNHININSKTDYTSLKEFRKNLPIAKHYTEIIQRIKANKVTIISGDTGSGKSTQIPQYIYEAGLCQNKLIGITQPRRVAAITLAQRVAKEQNSDLGKLVGYSVRFEDVFDYMNTKIKFMTDGMLIRELIIDPMIKKYSFIILDEAHERSLQTDILITFLKGLLQKRDDIKLVIMSATLETEKFMTYFENSYHINIEGRCFPISIYNTISPQADYLDSTLNTILQIHFTEEEGDILAFLTGQEDIDDLEQMLKEKNDQFPNNINKLLICPMYAALPSNIQLKAFEKTPPKHRKVVIATNIAETSITIDGIKYVVDCGLVKIKSYYPQKALETLLISPISKSSALQRTGRAGRQYEGKCYRLYTEETFQSLALYIKPEILRSNLSNVILQLKAIGVEDIHGFDFIDKPTTEAINNSIEILKNLKALDKDGHLTEHGREMAELPLEPLYSHLLLLSTEEKHGCLEQILSIIAILTAENLFYIPKDHKGGINKVLEKFKCPHSDHLTKLNILNKYLLSQNKQSFSRENFLNKKSLKRALLIRQQLSDYITNILNHRKSKENQNNGMTLNTFKKIRTNIDNIYTSFIPSIDFNEEKVIKCLAEGLQSRSAKLNANGTYTLASNQTANIHPESIVFYRKKKPEVLIYNEVIITKKSYLRDVTEIPNIIV